MLGIDDDGAVFPTKWVYRACVRALVNKFSPAGERVELGCVADKIGGDVGLVAAIEACVAERDAPPPDAADAEPDREEEVAIAETPGSSQNLWQGAMEPAPDAPTSYTWGERDDFLKTPIFWNGGSVQIQRTPGTNEFSISVNTSEENTHKLSLSTEALRALLDADVIQNSDPNWCATTTNMSFRGSGTFAPDNPRWIVFEGMDESSRVYDLCTLEDPAPPAPTTIELRLWVEVTDSGLLVEYQRHQAALPGSTAPISD